MSDAKQTEVDETELKQRSTVVDLARTVTPPYGSHPDAEMDTVGWAIFLGMVVLLVPFLPLLLAVWAIGKVFDALLGRETEGEGGE
jgi:hypothetical protein